MDLLFKYIVECVVCKIRPVQVILSI